MNSMERYGMAALVFLIVTVIAVVLWDPESKRETESEDVARTDARTEQPAHRANRAEAQRPPAPQVEPPTSPLPHELPVGPTNGRNARRNGGHADRDGAQLAGVGIGGQPSPSTPRIDEPSVGPGTSQPLAQPASHSTVLDDLRNQQRPQDAAPPQAEEPRRGGSGALFQPTPSASERTVVVQAGETLSEISLRELGSALRWREILELNGLENERKIRVGQELRLPPRGSAGRGDSTASTQPTTPAPASPTPSTPPSGPRHRVAAGESLWSIAQDRLGDGNRWREIAQANPDIDADRLAVGQWLALPEGASNRRTAEGALVATSTAAPRNAGGRVR